MSSLPSRITGNRYRQPDPNPTVVVGLPRNTFGAIAAAAERATPQTDLSADLIWEGVGVIRDAIATTDAANVTGSHVTSKPPTRREGGMHDDYTEEHPAYGMIGASRVSAGPVGTYLFGSDFRHQGYVVIRVHGAALHRGGSSDRVHAGRQIVELALSEAQWASFVSTMNMGDGVPATIGYRDGMTMPDIEPITDRREQAHAEMADTLGDAVAKMREAQDAAPTKALRQKIGLAIQEIEANMPFVAEQFERHTEKTVERGKIELDAWMTSAIQRAGLQALGATAPIELADPTSSLPSDEPALVETDGDEAGTVTR